MNAEECRAEAVRLAQIAENKAFNTTDYAAVARVYVDLAAVAPRDPAPRSTAIRKLVELREAVRELADDLNNDGPFAMMGLHEIASRLRELADDPGGAS